MSTADELLYCIFEGHLYDPKGDQTLDDLAERVVKDYMTHASRQGFVIPFKLHKNFLEDLKEEVLDMARKKTYGHSSLAEFRGRTAGVIEVSRKKDS